jgi:hypothetical protein
MPGTPDVLAAMPLVVMPGITQSRDNQLTSSLLKRRQKIRLLVGVEN